MTVASPEHVQALQEILRLDLATCTAEVCVASRKDSESLPTFRRIRLSEAIKNEFRDLAAASLFEYQKKLQLRDLEVLTFDVIAKLGSNQIEHIDLSRWPYDHIIEQTQPLAMLHGLDTFKAEPSSLDNLRFYVIVLRPPQGEPIYCYRRYTPTRTLRASSFLSIQRVMGNSDEFEHVTAPIFSFDEKIDCIGRGNDLFIITKNHFYYMFQILDELITSTDDALNLIRQRIPIEDFSLFSRACKRDKLRMQKLIGIAQKPYLDKLTIDDMKPAIKRHNLHIPIIIAQYRGQERTYLQFDPDYPWDILRLLDDDYLTSIMTGRDYAVDSKREP